MTDQLALDFERPKGKGPKVSQWQVDRVIVALYEMKGWQTAEDLGFRTENDKRILRRMADESRGHIISGQGGYRLNFEATSDENRVAVARLRSMRDQLDRRVIEIERVYHRKEVPEILRVRVEAARSTA